MQAIGIGAILKLFSKVCISLNWWSWILFNKLSFGLFFFSMETSLLLMLLFSSSSYDVSGPVSRTIPHKHSLPPLKNTIYSELHFQVWKFGWSIRWNGKYNSWNHYRTQGLVWQNGAVSSQRITPVVKPGFAPARGTPRRRNIPGCPCSEIRTGHNCIKCICIVSQHRKKVNFYKYVKIQADHQKTSLST